jgi:hypothetical protein
MVLCSFLFCGEETTECGLASSVPALLLGFYE